MSQMHGWGVLAFLLVVGYVIIGATGVHPVAVMLVSLVLGIAGLYIVIRLAVEAALRTVAQETRVRDREPAG